jgi:hypothetical protein
LALFKILKGTRKALDAVENNVRKVPINEGYCYVTTDEH